MNQLQKIDQARQALIEARSIEDVKELRDKAQVIHQFAKRRNYSREVQDYAAEFVIDAEIKMGNMLKETPKHKPGRIGRYRSEKSTDMPKLSELGISKNESSKFQYMAKNKKEINDKIEQTKKSGKQIVNTKIVTDTKRDQLKKQQSENRPIEIPKEKFQTIVIDPPWPVQKILRDTRPNQDLTLDYPTMTLEQIGDFPLREMAFKNCHVYLWTTHKFLPDAFDLFEIWGIKYQCLLTWVKNVGFTPFSWMYSTEHVLFGAIGSLELLVKGKRLDFQAKVREHSRKPDEFYDLVRIVSPEPRIDVFSTEKRGGFEQYGNQKTKF